MIFGNLCTSVRNRFLTEEHTRGLLPKRDNITLAKRLSGNSCRNAANCFNLQILKLKDVQFNLTKKHRKEVFPRNELLIAVKDIKACKHTHCKLLDALDSVIADLHTFLTAAIHIRSAMLDAHFVGRNFKECRRGHDLKPLFELATTVSVRVAGPQTLPIKKDSQPWRKTSHSGTSWPLWGIAIKTKTVSMKKSSPIFWKIWQHLFLVSASLKTQHQQRVRISTLPNSRVKITRRVFWHSCWTRSRYTVLLQKFAT